MKLLTATVVCGLVPTLAHAADVRNDRYTGASIDATNGQARSLIERKGDSDWYKVALKAGRDYGFRFFADAGVSIAIRSPTGRVLKRAPSAGDEGDTGIEFRPPLDGVYYIEVRDAGVPDVNGYPAYYEIGVAPDCRGGRTSQCGLQAGRTTKGLCNWATETDTFRLPLEAGRGYTFSAVTTYGLPLRLEIRDPSWHRVVIGQDEETPSLAFTSAAAGTYYGIVHCEGDGLGGTKYGIALH